jgi:uncharacterized membrane protein required for colicin V production
MSWVDLAVIVIVAAGALVGMRVGIVGGAITAVGGIVGWLLAGQLADDAGGLFDNWINVDTAVTVISYAVIVFAGLAGGVYVARIGKPLLAALTLGLSAMTDRLGGLVIGLIIGLVISAALIVLLGRATYSFELPEEGLAGTATARVSRQLTDLEVRESMEKALTESGFVRALVNVADALPSGALGFIPSDFETTFDLLGEEIDRKGG